MGVFLKKSRDSIHNTVRLDVYMRDHDVAGAKKLIDAGVRPTESMVDSAIWRAARDGRMEILSLLNEAPTPTVLIDAFVNLAWKGHEATKSPSLPWRRRDST